MGELASILCYKILYAPAHGKNNEVSLIAVHWAALIIVYLIASVLFCYTQFLTCPYGVFNCSPWKFPPSLNQKWPRQFLICTHIQNTRYTYIVVCQAAMGAGDCLVGLWLWGPMKKARTFITSWICVLRLMWWLKILISDHVLYDLKRGIISV